jgi:uncharacterized protein (DUF1015 family)
MARIYPFEALRYNPARVRVEDVVTQPYDKITPSLQQAYYQRSPYNLVRIILGLPELFDNATSNVYTRAAEHFQEWRKQGVLFHDNEPAIYAYSQLYAVPGEAGHLRERRGLIALGELVDYSEGVVFRHEKTLSKPKSDRLNLLRATHAHFGQIFMLYSDPVHTVEKLIFSSDAPPDIEVTDDYGVVHRLWKVSEPAVINLVTTAMADKKLIIADGHHRYETALNYSRERQPDGLAPRVARGTYQAPAYPEAAVMMTFVNMDSEGLTILPTHRVVRDLPNFSFENFLTRAREFFEVSEVSPARDPLEVLRSTASAGRSTFYAATPKGGYLLVARPEKIAEALPGCSDRQRKLDVAQLHGVILENLLGLSQESITNQTNLSYLRDAAEALDLVRTGQAQIAFLMNPATLDQLRDVAFAGEVMPQKSTDFYPKLLSGLTIYALD